MKDIVLGSTGITVKQNAFGALPIQRDDTDTAVRILRRAYEGGMTSGDTGYRSVQVPFGSGDIS